MLALRVFGFLAVATACVTAWAGDPKDNPASRDLKALAGTWEVMTHEVKINGEKAKDVHPVKAVIIADGKIDLFERGAGRLAVQDRSGQEAEGDRRVLPRGDASDVLHQGDLRLGQGRVEAMPSALAGGRPARGV